MFCHRTLVLNLALRRAFTWTFVITEVPTAILGSDFLTHYGLLVDLKVHRLLDPLTSLSSYGLDLPADIHSIFTVGAINTPDGALHRSYERLVGDFEDLTTPCGAAALLEDTLMYHEIHTTGPSVFERPRRLAGEYLAAAKRKFKLLLDHGIFRPSSSQWVSSLHLVAYVVADARPATITASTPSPLRTDTRCPASRTSSKIARVGASS